MSLGYKCFCYILFLAINRQLEYCEGNKLFELNNIRLHRLVKQVKVLFTVYNWKGFDNISQCGCSGVVHGCSAIVVEYQTRNREVAGSTHTRSTSSNIEQVANLLYAQANSASYLSGTGNE